MTKITIIPNVDQIRYYVNSALNAFTLLPTKEAIESNTDDLRALLKYLESLDDAANIVVASISRIKGGIRIERSTRDGDIFDLSYRYLSHSNSRPDSTQGSTPRERHEENVRLHDDLSAADSELDLDKSRNGIADFRLPR